MPPGVRLAASLQASISCATASKPCQYLKYLRTRHCIRIPMTSTRWMNTGMDTSTSGSGNEGIPGVCEEQMRKQSVAAGRVVTPEKDKEGYMPVGKGMDPGEEGVWLQPGVQGGRAVGEKEASKEPEVVEDKLTSEKLHDTDALFDRSKDGGVK